MPNDPLYQSVRDSGQLNDLMYDWLSRVISGRNPDSTSYTMPINIAADIPDFTTALQAAFNTLGAAVSGATSGLSDQVSAAQAAARGITLAAGTLPGAVASAVTAAVTTSTNVQSNILADISRQNQTIIEELGRIGLVLQLILGEDVSPEDANDTLVAIP